MFAPAYLQTAVFLLETYNGSEPFAPFLKKYFAAQKKFGSRDRKMIAHLCYCFFRAGRALAPGSPEDRIITALFLCSAVPNALLQALSPELNVQVTGSEESRLQVVADQLPGDWSGLYPWKDRLSDRIDYKSFCLSHLVQPDLFLRIRPGREKGVREKLQAAGLPYREVAPDCLALPNGTKADTLLQLDEEAVIQDLNSQKTILPLLEALPQYKRNGKAWDCCAASGGKSILLTDRLPGMRLTVSDVRSSILHNLKNRFRNAGISRYEAFVADSSAASFKAPGTYDVIVCDAPCSGSGTWGRTPEQLFHFREEKIGHYSGLQKKILANVREALRPDGLLLYITCSVFREENEAVVAFATEELGMKQHALHYFEGYREKADTLFASLLSL